MKTIDVTYDLEKSFKNFNVAMRTEDRFSEIDYSLSSDELLFTSLKDSVLIFHKTQSSKQNNTTCFFLLLIDCST